MSDDHPLSDLVAFIDQALEEEKLGLTDARLRSIDTTGWTAREKLNLQLLRTGVIDG